MVKLKEVDFIGSAFFVYVLLLVEQLVTCPCYGELVGAPVDSCGYAELVLRIVAHRHALPQFVLYLHDAVAVLSELWVLLQMLLLRR